MKIKPRKLCYWCDKPIYDDGIDVICLECEERWEEFGKSEGLDGQYFERIEWEKYQDDNNLREDGY